MVTIIGVMKHTIFLHFCIFTNMIVFLHSRMHNFTHSSIGLGIFFAMLYTLNFITSNSLMSVLLLYLKTLGNIYILSLNLTLCCHVSLPYIMGSDIKVNRQRRLHASPCHHCKLILFLLQYWVNVIPLRHIYTNLLWSNPLIALKSSLISHVLWMPHRCDITGFKVHVKKDGIYWLLLF